MRIVLRGIVGLPDDVSVRTSNRHGGLLRVKHEILGVWLHALPEPDDLDFDRPLDPAMLDVADEFPAATFELLNGYYRQAASSWPTLARALVLAHTGSQRPSGENAGGFWPLADADEMKHGDRRASVVLGSLASLPRDSSPSAA